MGGVQPKLVDWAERFAELKADAGLNFDRTAVTAKTASAICSESALPDYQRRSYSGERICNRFRAFVTEFKIHTPFIQGLKSRENARLSERFKELHLFG